MSTVAQDTLRRILIGPLLTGPRSEFCAQRYELHTYDTGRRDNRGQTVIGYTFGPCGAPSIFSGEDFAGSPMDADDSDETLRNLLGFLTLRPGDTDAEYFATYNARQLDWAASDDCEAMAFLDGEPDQMQHPEEHRHWWALTVVDAED